MQIVSQPQSRLVTIGSDVTIEVKAVNDGTRRILYEWQFEGRYLLHQTNSVLSLPQIRVDQLGTYMVIVYDGSQMIRSDRALLEISTTVVGWGYYSATNTPPNLTNVVAVAAGHAHTLALNADGTVIAWGDNSAGQTNVPPGLSNVVALAASSTYSMALKADGTVVGWGCSIPEGLSNVVAISATWTNLAVRSDGTVVGWAEAGRPGADTLWLVQGLSNAVAVSAGEIHNLALTTDRTVITWGSTAYGLSDVPPALNDVVGVAAGDSTSYALRANGTVLTWGAGPCGETNVPMGLHDAITLDASAGCHAIALKADGTVAAWGNLMTSWGAKRLPAGLEDVIGISAGYLVGVAVMGRQPPFLASPLLDRKVLIGTPVAFHMEVAGTYPFTYQWRLNGTNLPDATSRTLRLPTAIPGAYSVVVSNVYGTVTSREATLTVTGLAFALQPASQQAFLGGNAEFTAQAAGPEPITFQWNFKGEPLLNQTNSTLALTSLRPDQAGPYSVTIHNESGSITSSNALLTVIPMYIASQPMSQRVLQGSNPVLSVGVAGAPPFAFQWQYKGADLPDKTNSTLVLENVQLSQSGDYSVTISNAYTVLHSASAILTVVPPESWVDTSHVDTNSPLYRENLIAIAEGIFHTVGLKADRTVIAWGENFCGQTNVPPGLAGVEMIGAGVYHSLALTTNGTVFAWGDNTHGQTNVPAGLAGVTAISAGGYHNLALKADRTVVGWGENLRHQLDFPAGFTNIVAIAAGSVQSTALRADGTLRACGASLPPPGLSNIIAIASGGDHDLALLANGTVLAWGQNTSGETNVPMGLANVVAIAAARSLSLALRSDGSVVAWGDYWHTGDTNTPAYMTNVISISAGQEQSLALISYGAPHITIQPWDQYVPVGGEVAFTAKSVGPSLSYQWQFNGVDLPGATHDTLIIAKAEAKDAGEYALVASNAIGATKTRGAKLALAALPQPTPPAFVPQSLLWRDDTGFAFSITGEPGAGIEVQFSTDLANWETLTQTTNTLDHTEITDPTTNSGHRFYRLKQF